MNISENKIKKIAKKIIAMAEIRHNYFGIKIFVYPNDHNPAHVHASYKGYNSIFDINTGEEIEGNLPSKQKKQMMIWFCTEKDRDMRGWVCKNGNWKKLNVKKASYDLDKPLSKDNNFWNDMQIIRAIPYKNYDVELWFANGSHKIYNLKKTIDKIPEIAPLKKLNIFMNIIGVGSGLHWNEDVDLDAYEFFKYGKDI